MAEALVKTFKRDYVKVNPIPNAASALAQVRSLDGGLQHHAPALAAGLPLTTEISATSSARRVSALTASTPAVPPWRLATG